MENLKPMALISVSLLLLASVFSISLLTPVSAAPGDTVSSDRYIWLGGLLNVTFTLVNKSDDSLFARAIVYLSLDYWEDEENFTFIETANSDVLNVTQPVAAYKPGYSPQYSEELTLSMGPAIWYQIRMQWRAPYDPGFGKFYTADNVGDVDYATMSNITGRYYLDLTTGEVKGLVEPTGAWIGEETPNDPAGSQWCFQPLFINTTVYMGGYPGAPGPPFGPGEPFLDIPLVNVDMDNWLTTGDAYASVNETGHPLDGIVASGSGIPWDSDFNSSVLVSAGAVLNSDMVFEHPTTHKLTPMYASYIYVHKHLVAREGILTKGDATQDGYVNVWDLAKLSKHWLTDTQSYDFGYYLWTLESAGEWEKERTYTKEVNSVDFNGDEFVNVWDLGILSGQWLAEGWKPPTPM